MTVADAGTMKTRTRHIPGEAGVYIFIVGDMIIFSLFFVVFMFYRAHDVAMFAESQATLNQHYGAFNTLLLLTSSWFVVIGVEAARRRMQSVAKLMFPLAIACGVGFVIVKYFEWSEKIGKGITTHTNDFYMYYYMFTGIHLLHVIIGLAVLLFLWIKARRGVFEPADIQSYESGGVYWHMVDLLWIILFPLIYLVK